MKIINTDGLNLRSLRDQENIFINGGEIDCPICLALAIGDAAANFWAGMVNGFNQGLRSGANQ